MVVLSCQRDRARKLEAELDVAREAFAQVVTTRAYEVRAAGVLGTEFAGVVARTGAAVTRFAPGQRVLGLNVDRFGAHAELVALQRLVLDGFNDWTALTLLVPCARAMQLE
jgi:NADPH:quinone reductase-like Zn-dependent oxidoreductase